MLAAIIIVITIRYSGSPLLQSIFGYLKLFYYYHQNAVINVYSFQKPSETTSSMLEDSKMKSVWPLMESAV